jgi:hypothetical protein
MKLIILEERRTFSIVSKLLEFEKKLPATYLRKNYVY